MSYKTVRQAQQAAWPKVKESMRLHRASRAAHLRGEQLSSMEQRDLRKSIERVASDETVWALAKMDLLASQARADVIIAARDWAKSCPPLSEYDMDAEEAALYAAVQALATDPADIPDEEVLTELVATP